MSSLSATRQRKALKALAKTPYNVFDDEQTEVIVKKVEDENAERETDAPVDATVDESLSEDVSMEDNRGSQCGYCGDYHEHWIACDNKACRFQWYGLDCVGLVEAPAGRWLCALCRPRPILPKLAGASNVAKLHGVTHQSEGVATKKVNVNKSKQGWKGYVEVPAEVKEQMRQDVEEQWEVAVLAKRTRMNTRSSECKPKRRLRRTIERKDQSPQPANFQHSQQTNVSESPQEDQQWMDKDQLAESPADSLIGGGTSPISKPPNHRQDEHISDEEADNVDGGSSSRYNRESTFEGFSNPVRAGDVKPSLEIAALADEDDEGYTGDQSADDASNAEEFWDSEMTDVIEHDLDGQIVFFEDEGADAEESQDSEMTDGIEPDFDALSVEFEDEGADSESSEDYLADEVSAVEDDEGIGSRDLATDIGGGALRETLGVGVTDYSYLDLSKYGPYLVRRI